jgi:hypothetical protein
MAAGRHVGPRSAKEGKKEGMSSERGFYITPGKILTPVVGFSKGVLGTPPFPQMRGDAKPVGSEPAPKNVGKNFKGGNNALKAFGLQGSSKNMK